MGPRTPGAWPRPGPGPWGQGPVRRRPESNRCTRLCRPRSAFRVRAHEGQLPVQRRRPESNRCTRLCRPRSAFRVRAHEGQLPVQRRRPESNRCTRLCRPLPNHSATSPQWARGYQPAIGTTAKAGAPTCTGPAREKPERTTRPRRRSGQEAISRPSGRRQRRVHLRAPDPHAKSLSEPLGHVAAVGKRLSVGHGDEAQKRLRPGAWPRASHRASRVPVWGARGGSLLPPR